LGFSFWSASSGKRMLLYLKSIADCESQKALYLSGFFSKITTDFSPLLWYN